MSENEHQSYFCYLIGQKIYLPLFFCFFIPNLGLFGRLEREREEINKGGKQITQITWLTDRAVTIIRKSKPARPSQPDRRLVRWRAIFLSFQLCQSFDLIYSKNNKSTHAYTQHFVLPFETFNGQTFKSLVTQHWSKTSSYYVQIWRLYLLLFFFPSFECWTDRVSLVYKNRSILLPFLS